MLWRHFGFHLDENSLTRVTVAVGRLRKRGMLPFGYKDGISTRGDFKASEGFLCVPLRLVDRLVQLLTCIVIS
jgi:hypothetical protein